MLFVELFENGQTLETAVQRALAMLHHRGIRSFRLPTLIAVARELSPEIVGIDVPEDDVRRILERSEDVVKQGNRWRFASRGIPAGAGAGDHGLGLDVPGFGRSA